MGFTSLQNAIVALVDDIVAIKAVYNYGVRILQEEIKEYPVAVVLPSDNASEYLSFGENERTYTFKVFVVYKCEATSIATAQVATQDIIDALIDKFDVDTNNTLGGLCYRIEAMPSSFEQTNVSSSDVAIVATVMLRCHQLFNVK